MQRILTWMLTFVACAHATSAIAQVAPGQSQATSYDNVFTERFSLVQTDLHAQITTDDEGRIVQGTPIEALPPVNDANGNVTLLWGERDLNTGYVAISNRAEFPIVDGRVEMRIHELARPNVALMRADFFDTTEGPGGEVVRTNIASPVLVHFGVGQLPRRDSMDVHFVQPGGVLPFKESYLLTDVSLGPVVDTSHNNVPAGLLTPRSRGVAWSRSINVFLPETTSASTLRFAFTERNTARTYSNSEKVVYIDGTPHQGIHGIGGVYFESDEPLERLQLRIDDITPLAPYNETPGAPTYWALYENDVNFIAGGQLNWNHVEDRAPLVPELEAIGTDGYTLTPVLPLDSSRENRAFRLILFRAGEAAFLTGGDCYPESDDNWINACECFSEYECFTLHETIARNCGAGSALLVGVTERTEEQTTTYDLVSVVDVMNFGIGFGNGRIESGFEAHFSDTSVSERLHSQFKKQSSVMARLILPGHALTRQSPWVRCTYQCFTCRGAKYIIEVMGEGCWKCGVFRENGVVTGSTLNGPPVPASSGASAGSVPCSTLENPPLSIGGDPLVESDCE